MGETTEVVEVVVGGTIVIIAGVVEGVTEVEVDRMTETKAGITIQDGQHEREVLQIIPVVLDSIKSDDNF